MVASECVLVVVRHGETVDNVAGTIQGQTGGQLTRRGQLQADALGARLACRRFDAVYCSDLRRTVDTLDRLSTAPGAAHQAGGAVLTPLLRERAAGSLEGQPMAAMYSAVEAAGRAGTTRAWAPPGGESWDDVRSRAHQFLRLVAERHLSGSDSATVLAISHGGFMHELLAAAGVRASGRVGNTAVYELLLRRTQRGDTCVASRVFVANCTRHLPPELMGEGHANVDDQSG
jgi:broad specificity phosphatase PhoE